MVVSQKAASSVDTASLRMAPRLTMQPSHEKVEGTNQIRPGFDGRNAQPCRIASSRDALGRLLPKYLIVAAPTTSAGYLIFPDSHRRVSFV